MNLTDALQIAIESLKANKLRGALTMLGMVIGVGAVIALMAVGQGSQQAVTNQIAGLGANLLFIRPGSSNQSGVRGGVGSSQTLTLQDSQSIASSLPEITVSAPEVDFGLQVAVSGQNTFTRAVGVTPDYATALNLAVADGQFISDANVQSNQRVVVLGAAIAQQLFPNGGAVGQQIRATEGKTTLSLQVVGVLAPKGGTSQASQDNQIFLPLTTVQNQIQTQRGAGNTSIVSQITVQVANKGQINQAKTDITNLLLQRHKVAQADFVVESQQDISAAASQASQSLTVLLGAIAGISLLVGGIGIMNIMLVSVTERTREIGIRKAVGARGSDILTQFLTEALTVTILGGLLGVAAGVGAAQLLNGQSIAGLGNNVQTVVSWTSVALAFAVSAGIGVFFGIYPAQRAARLNPIEALRYQ